ncbi:MAG: YraN family protein [Bacillota bacterium]
MSNSRLNLGKLGEDYAFERLKKMGYRILHQNYRCPMGELDMIAEQDDSLVFIEVRTKSSNRYGTPAESITRKKQAKLRQMAMVYLSNHRLFGKTCRFDVVCVEVDRAGQCERIEIIKQAF